MVLLENTKRILNTRARTSGSPMPKQKANETLDGWFAKKAREDDVDSCTTVATAAAQNMECDE